MNWNVAIERNHEALKRVLAMLVAMAGLRGQLIPQDGAPSQGAALAEKLPPAPTLPRYLHRAVCKLLRPAEAAARRLIIVAARGLVVALPPPRKARPKRMATEPLLRSLGIAVTISPADLAHAAAARRAAAERAARPRDLSLPLFDPLPRWPRPWRPIAKGVPRISVPGFSARLPVRLPAPDDPVSAARLALRLEALGRALDNLPREARRFARWRAARDAENARIKQALDAAGGQVQVKRAAAGAQIKKTRTRFRRICPLKPGRPPGWRRRPTHEVHDILNVVHGLAHWALERPDTS